MATATLLDATQSGTPFNDVSLAIDHDALSIYNGFNGGSYVASTTPLLPLDSWVCIEWEVYTGTPNQLHAWINGQPVPALDLTQPTTATPAIGRFSIGLADLPAEHVADRARRLGGRRHLRPGAHRLRQVAISS